MWRTAATEEKQSLLEKAITFTGDHVLYGSFMMRVAKEWKYSCEHNLTDPSINQQAWIGHAACALAFGCPEDIVRKAWWNLTDEQRIAANKMADRAIEFWKDSFFNKQLPLF